MKHDLDVKTQRRKKATGFEKHHVDNLICNSFFLQVIIEMMFTRFSLTMLTLFLFFLTHCNHEVHKVLLIISVDNFKRF